MGEFQLLDVESNSVLAAGDDLEEIRDQLDLQIGDFEEDEEGWF